MSGGNYKCHRPLINGFLCSWKKRILNLVSYLPEMEQISQTSGDFGFKASTYGMLTTTHVLQNVINTSLRRTRQTDRMPQRMVLVHDEEKESKRSQLCYKIRVCSFTWFASKLHVLAQLFRTCALPANLLLYDWMMASMTPQVQYI